MELKKISMIQLHQKPLGPKDVILDVRAPDEYAEGHVGGSLNIPHDVLAKRTKDLLSYENIYIHCRSGKRAEMAAEVLLKSGFANLICVVGSGMPDWIEAGFPII